MGSKEIKGGEIRFSDILIAGIFGYFTYLGTNSLIYAIVAGLAFTLIAVYISLKRKQS